MLGSKEGLLDCGLQRPKVASSAILISGQKSANALQRSTLLPSKILFINLQYSIYSTYYMV